MGLAKLRRAHGWTSPSKNGTEVSEGDPGRLLARERALLRFTATMGLASFDWNTIGSIGNLSARD
jgi:hypothetical protein